MNWAAYSPVAQVATLLLGITASVISAYEMGHVSKYLPFISENGAFVPEICIFSYTLIIGSFFGLVAVGYRYLVVCALLPTGDKKLHQLNRLGLASGVLSMATLAGVAAFPMTTVLWGHLVTAGIHFGTGVAYLFLQTLLSFHAPVPGSGRRLPFYRLALSVFTLAELVLLGICFPVGYFTWVKTNEKPHALKTPQDQGFDILLASSVFEWLFEVTFLSFFLTMYPEFRKFEVSLDARLVTEPDKS